MAPQGTNLILTTHIPYSEADVFVFDSFNIETNGGDSCDNFAEFQFVQNCCFTGCIETNHEDTHLLLAKKALPHPRKRQTHFGMLKIR